MRTWIKRTVAAIVVLGVIGTAVAWYLHRGNGQAVSFETAKVTRGNLLVTIAVAGTLEPEGVVDVGAQISGRIVSFGKDTAGRTVDYGSVVEQGAVVAKIGDALYQADAAQTEVQVASEDALVQSTATVSTNLVALYKALGGGREEKPQVPGVQKKQGRPSPGDKQSARSRS
jgi:HlyD family secretion protein